MMTKQEIFNKIARHLLTQNKKARANTGSGSCMYRTPGGLKCAVGCLIPDEKYTPLIEGCVVAVSASDYDDEDMQTKVRTLRDLLIEIGALDPHDLVADVRFLRDFQEIHDCMNPSDWAPSLSALASTWDLDSSVLAEFA